MWLQRLDKKDFNPLPRKEGDEIAREKVKCGFNFNPLPRKEGDDCIQDYQNGSVISIHSLVKRETANIAKIQLKS